MDKIDNRSSSSRSVSTIILSEKEKQGKEKEQCDSELF